MYILPPLPEPNPLEKLVIEKICRDLMAYFKTPKGVEEGNRIGYLVDKWEAEENTRFDSLTDTEKKVLVFIANEVLYHRSPSIRAITEVVGLKSSRSGVQIVEALISRGYIKRDERGELEVV